MLHNKSVFLKQTYFAFGNQGEGGREKTEEGRGGEGGVVHVPVTDNNSYIFF